MVLLSGRIHAIEPPEAGDPERGHHRKTGSDAGHHHQPGATLASHQRRQQQHRRNHEQHRAEIREEQEASQQQAGRNAEPRCTRPIAVRSFRDQRNAERSDRREHSIARRHHPHRIRRDDQQWRRPTHPFVACDRPHGEKHRDRRCTGCQQRQAHHRPHAVQADCLEELEHEHEPRRMATHVNRVAIELLDEGAYELAGGWSRAQVCPVLRGVLGAVAQTVGPVGQCQQRREQRSTDACREQHPSLTRPPPPPEPAADRQRGRQHAGTDQAPAEAPHPTVDLIAPHQWCGTEVDAGVGSLLGPTLDHAPPHHGGAGSEQRGRQQPTTPAGHSANVAATGEWLAAAASTCTEPAPSTRRANNADATARPPQNAMLVPVDTFCTAPSSRM